MAAAWDQKYSDTLTYDMPADGFSLTNDAVLDLPIGIPDGSYTDVALFTLHKDADQVGSLVVDTGDNDVVVRLSRRNEGSSTVVTITANGQAFDGGNVMVACDYNIAIFPGGSLVGQGVSSFSKIKMTFQPW